MKKSFAASFVVPSYNGRHLLEAYLPSVVAASRSWRKPVEIIVVDDASTDGTVIWLAETYPNVRVLRLRRNMGFAVASNLGLLAARHPFVILLNNDVRVEPDFVAPLLEGLTRRELFAAAACMRNPDKSSRVESITRLRWEMGFLTVHQPLPEEASTFPDGGEILYASGGAAAYRRDLFLQLGGFDSIFHPFYWEDTDLCYRAWKRGLASVFSRDSVVWHRPGQTTRKVPPSARVRRAFDRNRLIFQWRNLSSARMFREHLAWLPRHLYWLARNERRGLLEAWLSALPKFPKARQQLSREKKREVFSDEELVLRLGATPGTRRNT